MKKSLLARGDVLRREIDGGAAAVVRVVYVSAYFKDLVLVAVYDGGNCEAPADVLSQQPRAFFYTGQDSLTVVEGWELLGSTPPMIQDREWSRRVVAGDVWVEDQCLGPVDESLPELPRMLVMGSKVLRRKLADALHG